MPHIYALIMSKGLQLAIQFFYQCSQTSWQVISISQFFISLYILLFRWVKSTRGGGLKFSKSFQRRLWMSSCHIELSTFLETTMSQLSGGMILSKILTFWPCLAFASIKSYAMHDVTFLRTSSKHLQRPFGIFLDSTTAQCYRIVNFRHLRCIGSNLLYRCFGHSFSRRIFPRIPDPVFLTRTLYFTDFIILFGLNLYSEDPLKSGKQVNFAFGKFTQGKLALSLSFEFSHKFW